MDGALSGTRVLDFGRFIAGPFCAALLGDLGADVIRIERPGGGEDRWVTPVADDGTGALYFQCNRNKRSLTLAVGTAEGREVVRRLVADSDVVVANLPPATLAHLGLDDDTLRAIKPDIVLATVTAFGAGGPWSGKVGFDGLAQAMSGSQYLSGSPGEPTRSYVPFVDYGTAAFTALATVAAIHHRARTGEGQVVETALLKTALTMSNSAVIEQALRKPDRVGSRNRSQVAGPADTFATRDGWVIAMAIGGSQFSRWCEMVGAPELVSDPRFATDETRGIHGEALSTIMADWCAGRTSDEALAAMEAHKVPGGPLYSPQQVLDDPHVAAIGFLAPTPQRAAAVTPPVSRFPATMSASAPREPGRAPDLGEHTDEILGELGYDDATIADLRDKGIL
ncbi:MAG: CoA transferase [Actinomycetota bacterium]|nr:CoA transferase [Actinomycetota bacterium]